MALALGKRIKLIGMVPIESLRTRWIKYTAPNGSMEVNRESMTVQNKLFSDAPVL
jgi:hypothetical protein